MTEHLPHNGATLPDETEARFTIRFLFVATGVVAIFAAVAGPLIRSFPAQSQSSLLFSFGIWLAATCAWIGFLAFKRRAAEQLVGRALLRVPMYDERVAKMSPARRRLNLAFAALGALMILFLIGMAAVSPPTGTNLTTWVWHYLTQFAICVWWPSHVITMFLWRNNVRFGERGLLWDRRAVLWDYVVSASWNAKSPDVLDVKGVDQHNRDLILHIHVPDDDRALVEDLLNKNVVDKPSFKIRPPIAELGSMPISEAVRDPRFRNLMGGLAWGFGCFAVVIYFRTGFTGVREFDQSILLGFFLAALIGIGWRRNVAIPLGVPLARTTTNRKWGLGIGAAVAAGVCYWLGREFGPSSVTAAYAFGISFGFFISEAIGTLAFRLPMDFRDNGVYMHDGNWPWNDIELLRWDAHSGHLALRLGRKRVAARVPSEQREVVDGILREKLVLGTDSPQVATNA